MNIVTLLACCSTLMTPPVRRQLAVIAEAMLTMTGRMTMLSVSRWTAKGGSYRTINRFFASKLAWPEVMTKFFQTHLFNPEHEYLMAGDETVIGKAGTETFGLDRFFSGLKNQVISGLSFFVLSLIDVQRRKSYPLLINQILRSEAEKAALKERKLEAARKKREPQKNSGQRRGRKPGSRNKNKQELNLSPELVRIDSAVAILLKLVRVFVKVKYLVMDGHFGHQQAVLMADQNDLHLISKLRQDAALYEKYKGVYSGQGAPTKYGEKVNYEKLPVEYLKKSMSQAEVVTNYYQGIFLSKSFGCALNVVIIEKINLKREKVGHVILFTCDTELSWEKVVEYYSLRFQIEFNFRDAKQHFGLEDFMNQRERGVENASNLAFLMVNVSAQLMKEGEARWVGINDLKSQYRGIKYAIETIKLIAPKAEPILIERVKQAISRIGNIHQTKIIPSSP